MIDYNYYASGNTKSSIVWEGDYEDDGRSSTTQEQGMHTRAMPTSMKSTTPRQTPTAS